MWASTILKSIYGLVKDYATVWLKLLLLGYVWEPNKKIQKYKNYIYKAFVLMWAVTIFHYHLPVHSRTRSPIFWLWSRVSANYCSCWDIRSIFITTTTQSKPWILLNYLIYQFISIIQIYIFYLNFKSFFF